MHNSIFLFNLLERSRIIRGNLFTTLSIGTIRTFITDSWRLVVILSRYSICSWNDWFWKLPPSWEPMDTRLFFAIISSLTWFISASSFSISTRTVRFVTGLPAGFDLVCAGLFSLCTACSAGFAADVFAGRFSCTFPSWNRVAVFTSSPTASAISDTFLTAFKISSNAALDDKNKLKSSSKRSSSISWELGL